MFKRREKKQQKTYGKSWKEEIRKTIVARMLFAKTESGRKSLSLFLSFSLSPSFSLSLSHTHTHHNTSVKTSKENKKEFTVLYLTCPAGRSNTADSRALHLSIAPLKSQGQLLFQELTFVWVCPDVQSIRNDILTFCCCEIEIFFLFPCSDPHTKPKERIPFGSVRQYFSHLRPLQSQS